MFIFLSLEQHILSIKRRHCSMDLIMWSFFSPVKQAGTSAIRQTLKRSCPSQSLHKVDYQGELVSGILGKHI
jgi:hypothetical protein